jgi:prolyl oligopeptidase
VPDPYRWLESLDSSETKAWVTAENRLTDDYLSRLPGRDALASRLTALVSHETYGLPEHEGGRYFWLYSSLTAAQPSVYTATALDEKPTLLVDPNLISPDGKLQLAGYTVSHDGKHLAYGLSNGGGDWTSWRVRETDTAKDTADVLEYTKYYPPAFTRDDRGLYYSRFPAPAPGKELSETDHDCKVYFHRLGTPASEDKVVYERPEHPTWQFKPKVTDDGRYLILSIGDGEVGDRGVEQLVYLDLQKPHAKPIALVDTFEAEVEPLGNEGSVFYVKTSLQAPNKRVVAIDLKHPDRKHWREVVPEAPEAMNAASLTGRALYVTRLKDAHDVVSVYALTGEKRAEVALPGLGTTRGFEGGGPEAKETFYLYTDFTIPGSIYRYSTDSGKSTLWHAPQVPFDAAAYETRQAFYPSKDGTKVPVYVVAKKGLALDGKNPTLLTGYGGFGRAVTPTFKADTVAWLQSGGVLAVANLRGGGEYGERWHRAGTLVHKQNVFDDFIAAAQWLESQGYTSPAHLGMVGGSNGGLLIGAVLTQRPDLFGAAAPLAGVLDMLRFPLFGQGAGWEGDYGDPQDADAFRALFAYSPVHNVRAGTRYPATLVVTADHDVRVAPLHSYKFAAALQAAQTGPAPILLRVETTSGHGGGTTRPSQVAQSADRLAFFAHNLGLALP